MADLTNRIAAARKSAGLTQAQLAERVGSHWITISKLERGKIKLTVEWAEKLADALKVPASDLFLHKEKLNIVKISGWLSDRGEINSFEKWSDDRRERQFELDAVDSENSIWVEIKTDDFYPIIQVNDLIKIIIMPTDTDPRSLIDRMVLALIREDGSLQERFGILGTDTKEGLFTLRPLSGSPIRGLKVERLGRVSTAIFDPGQIRFSETLVDKHPDHWREKWKRRANHVDTY
ncbi:helix-turn-helix domain-containing protein [Bosea eneae]|uniref:Helix-turn-helix domain-containing protein n=1 Tax=Bosea eneae TaxID=151454 RepID=A0ABW0IRY1_9HYPH